MPSPPATACFLSLGPRRPPPPTWRQEWQFAYFQAGKIVMPILRLGDFPLIPDELKLLHCEDFRDAKKYPFHLDDLVRQLSERVPPVAPVPPLGKLIAVPSLPAHFLSRPDRLTALRDAVRADLDRPVVISGAPRRASVCRAGAASASRCWRRRWRRRWPMTARCVKRFATA